MTEGIKQVYALEYLHDDGSWAQVSQGTSVDSAVANYNAVWGYDAMQRNQEKGRTYRITAYEVRTTKMATMEI